MRILIHSEEYDPTAQACSYRMKSFADAFLEMGDQVTVIASSANLANGTAAARRERVLYAPAIRMRKKTALMRLLSSASFGLTSVFAAWRAGGADIVITTSPPPLVSIPGWIIAKGKRAKLVYDVRDVWPDVALEMGSFSEGSLYCRAFRNIARFMYRHADLVSTVSWGKAEKIAAYLSGSGTDVRLVGNGFDESILSSPLDPDIVERYGLEDRFTCVYIGNIGLAQGLDTLLDVAARTRHREVQFLLFGAGAEAERLARRAKEEGLDQVRFCGTVPHDKVFTLLSKARLSFIPLKSANMRDSIPTKVYEALGVGCPVLLVAEGDSCEIVREAGLGRCVSPSRAEELPGVFDDMVARYDQYLPRRAGAMRLMREKYSRRQIASGFERELRRLLDR